MKKLFLMLVSALIAVSANATIYVVGAGDDLSWDLPGKAFEAGTDGKYVLELNNLTSFKFSTNYSTEWDGDGSFNAGAYATGSQTFDNSVYPNGQTLPIVSWGDNQSVPYKANYKITIDLTANTMTAQTSTPPSNEAPAVYIRGAVNGWNSFTSEWQFTNKTWTGTSGVYEWTGTIPAGSAFKIADDAWGQINYTTNNTGMVPSDSPVTLSYNSGDMSFASAFTGTITLNISNYLGHVATATFAASGGEVVPPTYPSAIYCIGELKDCGWDPTKGLKMDSTGEGVYSAEVELTGSYFAFATQLSSSSSDWGGLGTRYGATEADQPVVLDQNMTIAITGSNYSFKLDPGTYEITVSLADMTMLVKKSTSVTPSYPETLYVIGSLEVGDWNTTKGVQCATADAANGLYTFNNVVMPGTDGSSYFSFCTQLSAQENDWSGIGTRYGGATNSGTDVVISNGVAAPIAAYGDPAAYKGEPGVYTITVDLAKGEMTASWTEISEPDVPTPEPGEEIDAQFNFNTAAGIAEMASYVNPDFNQWTKDGNNFYTPFTTATIDGVTLTTDANGGTGTSVPKFYVTSAGVYTMRMSQNNTISVTAPEGYVLDEITFDSNSTSTTATNLNRFVLQDGQPGSLTDAVTSNKTRVWTPGTNDMMRAVNEVNQVSFVAGASTTMFAGITVKAHQVASIPPTELEGSLTFEDQEVTLKANSTDPVAVSLPISLDVNQEFEYQGFEFDITVPSFVTLAQSGIVLNSGLSSSGVQFKETGSNTYHIMVPLSAGTTLTEDIITLNMNATYSAGLTDGDYDVVITDASVIFSTTGGTEVDNIDGYSGKITLTVDNTVPATEITVDKVTLMEPSFTSTPSDMVESVTEGEQLAVEVTLTPANSTDDVTWSSDVDGVTVVWSDEENAWVVSTEGMADIEPGQTQEVTITATTTSGVSTTYTFTVKGVVLGDSNDNGRVNVADVVTTANYIAQKSVDAFCFPNANVILNEVDGKQVINTDDLTATISIAMGDWDDNRNPSNINSIRYSRNMISNDRLISDDFEIINGNSFAIAVTLENSSNRYAALQAEIIVPEGMNVQEITAGPRAAAHELVWNRLDNGNIMVVLYNFSNATFMEGEGALFNIMANVAENCGNVEIVNIHASDAVSNGYDLSYEGGVNLSTPTGIEGINAENAEARYFTVNGVEVKNPEAGTILIRVVGNKAEKVVF